jgi:hypothetical protein
MRNKAERGSPIGLLERGAEHTAGAVFVAIAYRASHPPHMTAKWRFYLV